MSPHEQTAAAAEKVRRVVARDEARQLHAAGLTKAEVARRLGVHRSTVGRWIGGRS